MKLMWFELVSHSEGILGMIYIPACTFSLFLSLFASVDKQTSEAQFQKLTLHDAQESLHQELERLIATASPKETPVSFAIFIMIQMILSCCQYLIFIPIHVTSLCRFANCSRARGRLMVDLPTSHLFCYHPPILNTLAAVALNKSSHRDWKTT